MSKLPYRTALYFLASLFLFVLAAINLVNYFNQPRVLGVTTQETDKESPLIGEKRFWENFLAVNPTYVPGWVELAKIEYNLGNTEAAKAALNEARMVSPNIEIGKLAPELEQLGKI